MTESVRIGELLLARGCLGEEQLARALEVQTQGDPQKGIEPGERLGRVILQLGLVEPMELVRCLCEQKGKTDFLVVDEYPIEPALVERIPRELALSLKFLPLVRLDEKTVLVAAAAPVRSDKVDFLRQVTGAEIEQIPVDDEAFREKIIQCYRTADARLAAAARLGELLVAEGVITPRQRDWALVEAKRLQKKVGRVLLEYGLVSEEELFRAFARQRGLALLSANDVEGTSGTEEATRQELASAVFGEAAATSGVRDRVFIAGGGLSPAEADRPGDRGEPVSIHEDIVNNLLFEAMGQNATHVHIDNHEGEVVVRLRVGGKLRVLPPLHITKLNVGRVIAVLKTMAGLDPTDAAHPQAGALKRRTGEGRLYDFRIQTLPGLFGENAVVRVLAPPEGDLQDLAKEMPSALVARDLRKVRQRKGLMLIAGPTTELRSRTAYATLDLLTKGRDLKVVTVEDPVERVFPGVVQSEVSYDVSYTFAVAVAGFQRVDPDVAYISELQDADSANGAFKLARSGCLVLAGMRTGGVEAALSSLMRWSLRPETWAEDLLGVLVRRPVASLCVRCKRRYKPSAQGLAALYGDDVPPGPFFRALGCSDCGGTGHQDQVTLSEYFAPDEASRKLLADGADPATILRDASRGVFFPLRLDIQEKVRAGLVDIGEAVTTLLGRPQR